MRTFLTALVLCCLAPASRAAGEPLRPRVFTSVPLPAAAPSPPGERSSASYRVEQNCPPGTWRWREPRESRDVAFDVVLQLLVLIEPGESPGTAEEPSAEASAPAEATGPSSPTEPAGLLSLGAALAELLQLAAPEPAWRDGDAGPGVPPDAPGLLAAWQGNLPDATASAAGMLAERAAAAGWQTLRLRAVVVRARLEAECASIERCVGGVWQPGGHRSTRETRNPRPPLVSDPIVLDVTKTHDVPANARAAIDALAAWLSAHYAALAADTALVQSSGDPCAAATPQHPRTGAAPLPAGGF